LRRFGLSVFDMLDDLLRVAIACAERGPSSESESITQTFCVTSRSLGSSNSIGLAVSSLVFVIEAAGRFSDGDADLGGVGPAAEDKLSGDITTGADVMAWDEVGVVTFVELLIFRGAGRRIFLSLACFFVGPATISSSSSSSL
jgi:hypothetical protein